MYKHTSLLDNKSIQTFVLCCFFFFLMGWFDRDMCGYFVLITFVINIYLFKLLFNFFEGGEVFFIMTQGIHIHASYVH